MARSTTRERGIDVYLIKEKPSKLTRELQLGTCMRYSPSLGKRDKPLNTNESSLHVIYARVCVYVCGPTIWTCWMRATGTRCFFTSAALRRLSSWKAIKCGNARPLSSMRNKGVFSELTHSLFPIRAVRTSVGGVVKRQSWNKLVESQPCHSPHGFVLGYPTGLYKPLDTIWIDVVCSANTNRSHIASSCSKWYVITIFSR